MQSYSVQAKRWIHQNRFAVLSSYTGEGYPFGSLVTYAVDPEVGIILQIAQISEHYKTITGYPKATLFIADPFGTFAPARFPRATVYGTFCEATGDAREKLKELYVNVLGKQIPDEIEPSFSYFHASIEKIRWIGGFAQVGWVGKEAYEDALLDMPSTGVFEMLQAVHFEHREGLKHFVAMKGRVEQRPVVIALSCRGGTIRLEQGDDLEFEFSKVITTQEELVNECQKLFSVPSVYNE